MCICTSNRNHKAESVQNVIDWGVYGEQRLTKIVSAYLSFGDFILLQYLFNYVDCVNKKQPKIIIPFLIKYCYSSYVESWGMRNCKNCWSTFQSYHICSHKLWMNAAITNVYTVLMIQSFVVLILHWIVITLTGSIGTDKRISFHILISFVELHESNNKNTKRHSSADW